jgi:hypothetical protein
LVKSFIKTGLDGGQVLGLEGRWPAVGAAACPGYLQAGERALRMTPRSNSAKAATM